MPLAKIWGSKLSQESEEKLISIGVDPSLQAQVLKKEVVSAGYWICSKCGELLPRTSEHFSKNNKMLDGLRPECNECRKNISHRTKTNLKKTDPDWHRAKYLSYNSRWRAKTQHVPVDKQFAEAKNLYMLIKKITHCECCGKKFVKDYKNKTKWEDMISLDKIVPSRGYVMGNVAFLCMRCNRIKLNATPDEVKVVADWMKKVWPMSA